MKKLTILALHLGYGGIEKAIVDLANNLSDKYEVEIISTYKLFDKPVFKLNSSVKVKYLMTDLKPNREEFWGKVKHLKLIGATKEAFKGTKVLLSKKKLMKKAIIDSDSDILISTRVFHNKLLSKYGKKNVIKVGWEHNYHQDNKGYFNKVVSSVKGLNYLVLVSENLFKDYDLVMNGKSNCKCVYIPNMIDVSLSKTSKLDTYNLINVSRLSHEKGLEDLIDIINILKKEIPKIKLNLIGDGPLKSKLENKIKSLKLGNNVVMHGFKDSSYISKTLLTSSLYVMTSFTESFGLSLVESFSQGVPAVAFDSANGAKQLIKDGYNGNLIPYRNKELMAEKIIELLNDKKKLEKYGKNAYSVSKEYFPSNVIPKWIDILQK